MRLIVILIVALVLSCARPLLTGRVINTNQVSYNRQAVLVRVGTAASWFYLPEAMAARYGDSVQGQPRRVNTGDPLPTIENVVITPEH